MGQDLPGALLAERVQPRREVAADDGRPGPAGARRVPEKTALGTRFMASAMPPAAAGKYCAISSYVARPMMCTTLLGPESAAGIIGAGRAVSCGRARDARNPAAVLRARY
jgi:hypothetical protein